MTYHKNVELAGTVTVGPKGQVVIPAEVREQMGILPGSKLVALYFNDKKSIAFVSEDQVQDEIDKMSKNVTEFKSAFIKMPRRQ